MSRRWRRRQGLLRALAPVGLLLARVTLPPEALNVHMLVKIAESGSLLAAQQKDEAAKTAIAIRVGTGNRYEGERSAKS
jgi:hypothetical protein